GRGSRSPRTSRGAARSAPHGRCRCGWRRRRPPRWCRRSRSAGTSGSPCRASLTPLVACMSGTAAGVPPAPPHRTVDAVGPRGSRARPVYRITAAQRGLSEELRNRSRRYLWTMGIRTACLLGAVLAHGPLRWVLVVGAVLLPWVAVVTANAGRERD